MSEPIKIEPHYQAQGKRMVDVLFAKGYFSETLSRGGMNDVEVFLALSLQLGAESAARCTEMSKKYKATSKGKQEGEDQPRHEEEIRWIARAREAEGRVAELEGLSRGTDSRIKAAESRVAELEKVFVREKNADKAWKWGHEVGAFLKETLSEHSQKTMTHPFYPSPLLSKASRLFTAGITLGIIPEPDCRPVETWEEHASEKGWPGDGCPCPPDPGVIPEICPRCGGRKV